MGGRAEPRELAQPRDGHDTQWQHTEMCRSLKLTSLQKKDEQSSLTKGWKKGLAEVDTRRENTLQVRRPTAAQFNSSQWFQINLHLK